MAIHTNWKHKVITGQVALPQIKHLERCIQSCGEAVTLIEPFDLWAHYQNSDSGQLKLYAHQDWKHINDIVDLIDQQHSKWVYVGINRYLLICDPDPANNPDYDKAIFDYIARNLKRYKIVDYQYQQLNHTGNVGNFVSPDNRILCKKNY